MKIKYNSLNKKCETCGKPAQWEYYENALLETYVAEPLETHYYCDRCNQKKYED